RSAVAREMGQVIVCEGLEDEKYKNCVELIAFEELDETACEYLSDGVQDCVDTVILRKATDQDDYSMCSSISDDETRTSCYDQLMLLIVADDACVDLGIDASVCDQEQALNDAIDAGDPAACETLGEMQASCEDIFKSVDPDRDGLSSWEEFELGTDPANADTDGDGYDDGTEVAGGYDPLS
ncbi:MAG: hypothetical protein ABIA47_01455, partial [bacterium]